MQIYDSSTQDIEQGYTLYKQLNELNSKKDILAEGNHIKISDIFIIETKQGLEFVDKKSWKGGWANFKNKCGILFGRENKLQKNLEKASKLISRATQYNTQAFTSFIKDTHQSIGKEDAIKQALYAVGIELKQLHTFMSKSRQVKQKHEKAHAKIAVSLSTGQISTQAIFKTAAEIKELLKKTPVTKKAIDDLALLISTYAKGGELISRLTAFSENSIQEETTKLFTLLQHAVLDSMNTMHSEDSRYSQMQKLYELLCKDTLTVSPQPSDNTLHSMTLIFRDTFLKESDPQIRTDTSAYAKLASESIDSELKHHENNPPMGLIAIKDLLDTSIDISKVENIEQLQKSIRTSPTQKRLIHGGFADHSIIYEIEKQKNGKYSFRAYGTAEIEGEASSSRKKLDSCISLKNIPEKLLFKKSFFECLKALKNSPSKAGCEFLINELMPTLCGEQEEVPPHIQSHLSKSQSGNSSYRSLLACLANNMSQTDYAIFKMNLKLSLLTRYESTLQAATTGPIPASKYTEKYSEYKILRQSVEKFSQSLKKIAYTLHKDTLKNAESTIDRFHKQLNSFSLKLIECEKSAQKRQPLENVTTQPLEPSVQIKTIDVIEEEDTRLSDEVSSQPLPKKTEELYQTIQQLPPVTDEKFFESYNTIISSLGDLDRKDPYKKWLYQTLAKKIGPIDNWNKIQFPPSNSSASFNFQSPCSRLLAMIGPQSTAEDYAVFLFFIRGYEVYYKKSASTDIPQLQFEKSIIDPKTIDFMARMPCHDPFWKEQIHTLESMKSKMYNPLSCIDLTKDTHLSLPSDIEKMMISWYQSEEMTEIRNAIQSSIAQDRIEQKKQIQEQTEEIQSHIQDKTNKSNTLLGEIEQLNKQIVNKQNEKQESEEIQTQINKAKENRIQLEKEISELKNQLKTYPDTIYTDRRYWPLAFDSSSTENKASQANFLISNASFINEKLKGNTQDNVLGLQPFFTMLNMAMEVGNLMTHVINKDGYLAHSGNFHFAPNGRYPLKVHADHIISQSLEPYTKSISNPGILNLTQELFSDTILHECNETNVPKLVDTFLDKNPTHHEMLERDVITEFFSIKSNKTIQIDSLLTYFSQHSEKLGDNNWMNLFHALLFDKNLLCTAFQNPKEQASLAQRLHLFFKENIENALEANDIATAANLLWMAHSAQNQLTAVQTHSQTTLTPLPVIITLENVCNQFSRCIKESDEISRKVVFESIVACNSQLFKFGATTESEKELFTMGCIAKLFTLRQPPIESQKFLVRNMEAQEALTSFHILHTHHKNEIGFLPEALNKYGASMMEQLFPSLQKGTFSPIGDTGDLFKLSGPNSEYGNISLTQNQFSPVNKKLLDRYSPLPPSLIELLKKEKVFTEEENFSQFQCHIHGNNYEIKGPNGLQLFVKDDHIYIKTAIPPNKKEWLLHLSSNQKQKLTPQSLYDTYAQRQYKDTIYLCDPKNHKPVYTLVKQKELPPHDPQVKDVQGTPCKIIRIDDQAHIVTPENPPFTNFEKPEHMIFLANKQNKLEEVQFSRLGITLQKKDGGWHCKEMKGWQLAPTDEQFIPHLGSATGFIVLKNGSEKKAILPLIDIHADSTSVEIDKRNRQESSKKMLYSECSVKDNRLTPYSAEARFQIAHIYMQTGYLEEAERLLFDPQAVTTHEKLSDIAIESLKSIILQPSSKSPGNVSGKEAKMRMQALYLLLKNKQATSNISYIAERKPLLELATEYIKALSSVEPLNPDCELYLLQQIDYLGAPPSISVRIKELKENVQEDIFTIPGFINTPEPVKRQEKEVTPLLEEPVAENKTEELPTESAKPIDKPRFGTRFRYFKARARNRFPFDPATASYKEIEPYIASLKKEAASLKTWEIAAKKGFIQAVHLFEFSEDSQIKNLAIELKDSLKPIITKRKELAVRSTRQTAQVEHIFARRNKEASHYQKQPLDLDILSHIQLRTEDIEKQDTFFTQCSTTYFSKQIIDGSSNTLPVFTNTSAEIKDSSFEKFFAEAGEDMAIAEQKLNEIHCVPNEGTNFLQLQQDLQDTSKEHVEKLILMENAIINALTSTLTLDPVSQLEFIAKKRRLPTMQELAVVCTKKNYIEYARKLYPELSETGLKQLRESVQKYMVQKQFVQQIQRVHSQVTSIIEMKKKNASEQALQPLFNNLVQTIESKREYPFNDPHASIYLFIETILNIKMRPEQVEKIRIFIDNLEQGNETVLQMIMGGGKTSVLQPILGFLFASPKTLSVVDVPDSLLAQVKTGLNHILGNAFQQNVYVLEYKRENGKDINFLKNFYNTLTSAKKEGNCCLRTPHVKHSIITSLYEAYCDDSDERIELISKIVSFLGMEELVNMDEIDLAMNPKVIFKYPVGEATVVHQKNAAFISNLVLDIAEDTVITESVAFDFVTTYNQKKDSSWKPKGASPTLELYKSKVAPRLVELATQKLPSGIITQENKEYITHFLSQTTPYDIQIEDALEKDESIETLLKDKASFIKKMNESLSRLSGGDKELLATIAHSIKTIFPQSLLKECGTQYGLDVYSEEDKEKLKTQIEQCHATDQEKLKMYKARLIAAEIGGLKTYIARPYAAAKTPKKSVYGDPFEQVIYSTQMTLNYGVPKQAASAMLDHMRASARKEIRNGCKSTETDGYKKFVSIMGEKAPFLFFQKNLTNKEYDAFTRACSSNPAILSEFLQTSVHKQIKQHSENISSTPQTLTGSSKKVFGFTGTLPKGILSRTATALAEQGTDGKTILAVEQKMESGLAKTAVYSNAKTSYPNHIIEQMATDQDTYVFIDSGGWLKDESMKDFAIHLLETCKEKKRDIEGIVYHNDKGELLSLERSKSGELIEIPLSESQHKTTDGKLLTLIAQRYETGTNIPQKPTAKGIMSVRKGMTKRDGLQSVFRMRQILQGQSISFAVAEDVKDAVAGAILEGLLTKEVFRSFINGKKSLEDVITELKWNKTHEKLVEQLLKASEKYKLVKHAPKTQQEKIKLFSDCFSKIFTPDSKDIWRYLSVNEALLEQSKNWDAAKHKMREVIEKPLRQLLSDISLPLTTRKKAFEIARSFLVQKSSSSLFEKMTKETSMIEASKAIENEKKKYLQIFQRIQNNPLVKEAYDQKVQAIAAEEGKQGTVTDIITSQLDECVDPRDIAPLIESPPRTDEMGNEVEVETEEEVEKVIEKEEEEEMEIEVEVRPISTTLDVKPYTECDFVKNKCKKLFDFIPKNQGYERIFPDMEELECSPNLMLGGDSDLGSKEQGTYHVPGRYILFIYDKKPKEVPTRRSIMVSNEDAARIKQELLKSNPRAEMTLFSVTGETIASSVNNPLLTTESSLNRMRIQLKLSNGNICFNKREIEELDKMEYTPETAKELQAFYENHILAYLPGAVKEYKGSALQKWFQKKAREGLK